MIFIDTGYLLAFLNPQDSLHGRAVAWSAHLNGPFLTTEYVIWETLNYFSRPAHRPKAHLLIGQIRNSSIYGVVGAPPELFETGIQYHRDRPDKAWSLTDCISFIVMQNRSILSALTFDQHFEQAGFEALLRKDPSPNGA